MKIIDAVNKFDINANNSNGGYDIIIDKEYDIRGIEYGMALLVIYGRYRTTMRDGHRHRRYEKTIDFMMIDSEDKPSDSLHIKKSRSIGYFTKSTGYIVAPALKLDIKNKKDIAFMLLTKSELNTELEDNNLYIDEKGTKASITVSKKDDGLDINGSIESNDGRFRGIRIEMYRHVNDRIINFLKTGKLNIEDNIIGDFKRTLTSSFIIDRHVETVYTAKKDERYIDTRWKPKVLNDDYLLVFEPVSNISKGKAIKNLIDNEGYVINDGSIIDYELQLTVDRRFSTDLHNSIYLKMNYKEEEPYFDNLFVNR